MDRFTLRLETTETRCGVVCVQHLSQLARQTELQPVRNRRSSRGGCLRGPGAPVPSHTGGDCAWIGVVDPSPYGRHACYVCLAGIRYTPSSTRVQTSFVRRNPSPSFGRRDGHGRRAAPRRGPPGSLRRCRHGRDRGEPPTTIGQNRRYGYRLLAHSGCRSQRTGFRRGGGCRCGRRGPFAFPLRKVRPSREQRAVASRCGCSRGSNFEAGGTRS